MEASRAGDEPLTNCFFIFFMEVLWVKKINQKDFPQTGLHCSPVMSQLEAEGQMLKMDDAFASSDNEVLITWF